MDSIAYASGSCHQSAVFSIDRTSRNTTSNNRPPPAITIMDMMIPGRSTRDDGPFFQGVPGEGNSGRPGGMVVFGVVGIAAGEGLGFLVGAMLFVA